MKTIITTLILILVTTAQAASWRDFMSHCNNNKACAQEQLKAYELWNGQSWDADLKQSCSSHVSASYNKERDYVAAVNCVYPLQTARQDYQAQQAQIKRDLAEAERAKQEARYYKRGGSRVVIP
jgi:hypothetical protein